MQILQKVLEEASGFSGPLRVVEHLRVRRDFLGRLKGVHLQFSYKLTITEVQ